MLIFDGEYGEAFLLESNIEENGWIVTYNRERYKFLIWSNVERYIEGTNPDKEVDTLEQVLYTIRLFT